MNKKVLILAYKFPPMGTIGTRRWAKFAKFLAKENIDVYVLARKYKYKDIVNWCNDIKLKNIKIFYFNTSYPMICLKNRKNIYEKIICKLYNIIRTKFFNKIDIADANSFDFFQKANNLIKKYKIKNVIVTAPPHVFSYYATILKSENPYINLLIDYRDPWNYFSPYMLDNLSFKAKRRSLYMESQVIEIANHIFCVTQDMTNNLKNLYPIYKNKITTLYNGFDIDDYKNIKKEKLNRNYKEILYVGSLDKGRLEAVNLIIKALSIYNKELNIKFVFYSNINKTHFIHSPYKLIIEKYFEFNDFIPKNKVLEKVKNTDICLSINSKNNTHAFGTKIFDYLALNKMIWHISNGGELFFLLKHHGFLVSRYKEEEIMKIFDKISLNNFFNIDNSLSKKFDLFFLTKELLKYIQG
jgi:hypothetical protein